MIVQAERPMRLTTPLGKDALVLIGFQGHEGISQLFHYHIDMVSEEDTVAFEKVLGQKVTVEWELRGDDKRYFNGIVSRFSQGERSFTLTRFHMEVVPQLWLLTRKVRSRIFQHITVPDILKKVLTGFDVSYEIVGSFKQRDYCTQYRESDFNFISRLMEEEGIYYYFKQTGRGHTLVLANTPQSHPDLPGDDVIYEEFGGGTREEERVWHWEKTQSLRSGKYTLWDHCFELPGKHLEAEKPVVEQVMLGRTAHKLKVGGNDSLEIYDYPGGYAQRFDGIDKSGGERASDVQNIFEDNRRTVELRMQEETAPALTITGDGNCHQFAAGYKFGLARHFSDGGKYVITSVEHRCEQPLASEQQGEGAPFQYENRFTCIPYGVPFRPPRVTPVPAVQGSQTATVVGAPGEEIFTDKYGRVKVQFHWDREGLPTADSSCWVRVGTVWAGKRFGMIHIPRIGQEVIVDFLEGHPDQPIVVGSVYNAEQMPPYKLPDWKTKSGIRSQSTIGGGRNNCNEIRFEDKVGSEQFFMKAEKDMDAWVQNDCKQRVGRDRHVIVERDLKEHVKRHRHVIVKENHKEKIEGNEEHLVKGTQKITVNGSRDLHVKGSEAEQFAELSVTTDGKYHAKAGSNYAMEAGQAIHIKGGTTVVIEAGVQLTIKAGGNFVDIGPAGVSIKGTMVLINSGGAAGSGGGSSPSKPSDAGEPEEALEADNGLNNVD